MVKKLPAVQETWVRKMLVGKHGNPLQYSRLENPRTEELGRLQSMGLQRVGHIGSGLAHTHAL